jgi:hypothetical protein
MKTSIKKEHLGNASGHLRHVISGN